MHWPLTVSGTSFQRGRINEEEQAMRRFVREAGGAPGTRLAVALSGAASRPSLAFVPCEVTAQPRRYGIRF